MPSRPLASKRKPVVPSAEESLRRRHLVKALMGAAVGGALGYAGYPWIAGDQQQQLADAMQKIWDRIKEHPSARHRREMAEHRARQAPIILDTHGREYEAFLKTLNLRYLTPMEVLRPHFKVRGTVANCLPPRELWHHLAATLQVADEVRHQLGVRLIAIVSAYRSPSYNAACPGAARSSFHMQNMALDLVYDCDAAHVVKTAEALRTKGSFKGGIGRYAGFTHIDTRGTNADWQG